MRIWYFIGVLSILGGGSCLKDNPEFCNDGTACPGDKFCDRAHHRCEPQVGSAIVTSLSPSFGSPDQATPMTLTGSNLFPGMMVHIDGVLVPTTFASATTLQFQLPPAKVCQPVKVTVTTPGGQLVPGSLLLRYKYAHLAYSSAPRTQQTIPGARAVAAGLLDSDKVTDLVLAGSAPGLQVLSGIDGLSFAPARPLVAPGSYSDVVVSDLDRNNVADIVTRHGSGIDVCQATANSPYSCSIRFPKALANTAFAIADLNKDGDQDLLALSSANQLGAFFAGPTLDYSGINFAHTFFEFMGPGTSLVAGDFNMDGNPDIATAVRANQAVFVLLGSGDGSFPTPATVFSAPDPLRQQPPALLAVLDVDQDGRDDLIVATDAQSDGSLTLALSRGAGFVTTPIAPVLPTPQILLTEDLDCDGLKDIILYNSGGNQISVYLNSGVGGFISTPQMITVTNAVLSMAVANLDATDLRPDIVVLSQTGPTLATYQNVSN